MCVAGPSSIVFSPRASIRYIQACKDTQRDPDFMVVARLEAFITGYGLDEAYKRADAYHR